MSSSTPKPRGNGLRDIKPSTKMTTSFCIVSIIVAVVGGLGIWGMNKISSNTLDIAKVNLPKISA